MGSSPLHQDDENLGERKALRRTVAKLHEHISSPSEEMSDPPIQLTDSVIAITAFTRHTHRLTSSTYRKQFSWRCDSFKYHMADTYCSFSLIRQMITIFVLNTSLVRCSILSKLVSGPVFHILN